MAEAVAEAAGGEQQGRRTRWCSWATNDCSWRRWRPGRRPRAGPRLMMVWSIEVTSRARTSTDEDVPPVSRWLARACRGLGCRSSVHGCSVRGDASHGGPKGAWAHRARPSDQPVLNFRAVHAVAWTAPGRYWRRWPTPWTGPASWSRRELEVWPRRRRRPGGLAVAAAQGGEAGIGCRASCGGAELAGARRHLGRCVHLGGGEVILLAPVADLLRQVRRAAPGRGATRRRSWRCSTAPRPVPVPEPVAWSRAGPSVPSSTRRPPRRGPHRAGRLRGPALGRPMTWNLLEFLARNLIDEHVLVGTYRADAVVRPGCWAGASPSWPASGGPPPPAHRASTAEVDEAARLLGVPPRGPGGRRAGTGPGQSLLHRRAGRPGGRRGHPRAGGPAVDRGRGAGRTDPDAARRPSAIGGRGPRPAARGGRARRGRPGEGAAHREGRPGGGGRPRHRRSPLPPRPDRGGRLPRDLLVSSAGGSTRRVADVLLGVAPGLGPGWRRPTRRPSPPSTWTGRVTAGGLHRPGWRPPTPRRAHPGPRWATSNGPRGCGTRQARPRRETERATGWAGRRAREAGRSATSAVAGDDCAAVRGARRSARPGGTSGLGRTSGPQGASARVGGGVRRRSSQPPPSGPGSYPAGRPGRGCA